MDIVASLDIAKLREKYDTHGVVTFPLLTESEAEKYRTIIIDDVPKEDWQFVVKTPIGQTKIPWSINNLHLINSAWNDCEQYISQPRIFACRYYQIPEGYNWPRMSVISSIQKEEVLSRIKDIVPDITGIRDTVVMSLTSGCFINEHTDAGRGKAAFVYQLSKDPINPQSPLWHPMYGGILHFPYNDITVVPKFNTITIMKTGPKGIVHCVTPVANYIKGSRVSIAGILY